MSSHRPVVQAIPPFKGGPLQATDVQNRRPTAAEAYVALANRKAGANVVSTRATGSENYRPAHHQATSHHASQRQQPVPAVDRRPPQQQQAPSERPKPVSRLEREKKRHHNDPKHIGHWKLDKLIGQGASGRVRLAVHDQTGQRAAVKIIPRTLINASRMSLRDADVKANKMILGIEREIVIMKLIEHPNLLGLWDVYETSKDLFLIMEYVAGGELFDHLVAQGKLTPRDARGYFRQIIFGMDYCHRFNICHRDLKPENLLLDETKKIVKIADFGMAALQPTEKMLETSCGSPHYASPEIVSGKRYKGTASDIWSCGIILFALLCGRLPFDDPNIQQLLGKVRAGKFMMPEWLEPASKDLIWRMLEVDPEKRIKMTDIMRHPWFTNNGKESSVNPVSTSLDTLQMEQLTLDTIDVDILGNLKTLWSELSEDDIVKELLAPGPSWQKTFYTLLVAHRENHSADDEDDMDGDFMNEQIVTASAVPAHALLSTSSAAKSLEKARPRRPSDVGAATSAPSSPLLESAEMDRRHSTPEKGSVYNTTPTRQSDAATPTKVASPHVRPANPSPRLRPSPLDSPAAISNGTYASPSRLRAPVPMEKAASTSSPRANKTGSYVLPQISLQTASPQRNERPSADLQRRNTSPTKSNTAATSAPPSARVALANLYDAPTASHAAAASSSSTSSTSSVNAARTRANRGSASEMLPPVPLPGRASSRPVSPMKTTFGAIATLPPQPAPQPVPQRPSPARAHTTTAAAPSIQVPQVGDATMQKFFQEIADELASIRKTGDKPDALQSKLEQLKSSMAQQRPPQQQQPQPSASADRPKNSEVNQFEDAEDDVSEGESVRSVSQTYTASTPMTPLSPAELIAPLSLTDKMGPGARTSVASTGASSTTSARNSVRSGRSAVEASSSGATSRPTSVFSNISTGSTGLGRKRSLLGLRRGDKHQAQQQQTAADANTIRSIAYDQAHAPPALASIFAAPGVGRSGQAASNASSTRTQKLNPGLGLDMGAHSAGGVISPPTTPVTPQLATLAPVAASHSYSTAPGKKDSWFAGLFNWKPATFTLMSTENFSETLSECVRRLQSYGVRVAMDDSSDVHHTTLKCTINEYRESNGVVTAAKPLRFRVELNILPVGSTGNSPQVGGGLGLTLNGSALGGGVMNHGLPSPALSTRSRGSSAGGVTFATSVQVVQEKGALSTFKLVHGRLRREWTLDLASAVI
ncbi:Protein kinase domain protein [Kalmanozyma brasiliensis GHG001]|uniref:non-specific serine/threonine protein kinase n=1 Tax=Kalmanozyma brasiliensis (strain GHG001) TaxID=1365824 RepID=V5GER8_KALBG|nr:Protein kinase domain protein [Kalmanozyma brasiliensis GHG001]EST04522.1 Protein kinase domain protein [Kalmanozyma brasiliensis GHG001]